MKIVKTFIILLIGAMMAMPVSATWHSAGNDAGALGGAWNTYDSWAKPWVGVPRLLDGTWKIDGQIYHRNIGPYHYLDSGKTGWNAWRRMFGRIYTAPYITSCKMTGGWYD